MGKETLSTRVSVAETKISSIKEKIKTFVTLDRFNPVEKIVWTITLLLVTSVIGAGLALVLKQ